MWVSLFHVVRKRRRNLKNDQKLMSFSLAQLTRGWVADLSFYSMKIIAAKQRTRQDFHLMRVQQSKSELWEFLNSFYRFGGIVIPIFFQYIRVNNFPSSSSSTPATQVPLSGIIMKQLHVISSSIGKINIQITNTQPERTVMTIFISKSHIQFYLCRRQSQNLHAK